MSQTTRLAPSGVTIRKATRFDMDRHPDSGASTRSHRHRAAEVHSGIHLRSRHPGAGRCATVASAQAQVASDGLQLDIREGLTRSSFERSKHWAESRDQPAPGVGADGYDEPGSAGIGGRLRRARLKVLAW
ncbi:hypothetical protein GCM10023146_41480 [Nocardioides caricicola]